MKKINLVGGVLGDFPIVSFLFMCLLSVFATATIANASTTVANASTTVANASTRMQGGDMEATATGDGNPSIDTRSAGDEGNVSFSIPTEVPCVMLANGDVISPSNWEIRNTCQREIKLSGASVSSLNQKAEDFDWKLYEGSDNSGRCLFRFSKTFVDYSDSFTVSAGKSVSCRWWCDAVDSYIKHNSASKLHIASVSFSFKSNEPTEFAVYSDDDKSLKFYSRIDVPSVGDTFNGSKVTAVYTGLKDYTYAEGEDHNGIPTTPWAGRRSEIKCVDIVDRIHPSGISFWFQRCEAITEFRNLGNIDVSRTTTIDHTFYGCSSVESIDCSSWDVSNVTKFDQVFGTCAKLKKVDITGWNTSKAVSFLYMFYSDISLRGVRGFPRLNLSNCHSFKNNFDGCRSITTIDFSRLNLPPDVDTIATIANCANLERITVDANFCWAYVQNETLSPTVSSPSSEYIEGVDDYGYWYDSSDGKGYLPTNMPQHHAATYYAVKPCFAVYSADDGSLCFYKRFDKPQEGGAIDGKTVTRLYDWGIEYKNFEALKSEANEYYPLLPWIDEIQNVKSVKAVDSGIRPKALSNWCYGMSNATSIDLTLIDTSRCTDFRSLFINCSSIEMLDLSNMDMSKMSNSMNMYLRCFRLKKISVSDTFRYAKIDDINYSYLPVPDSNVIDGADGKWYDEATGEGYAPKDVPTGGKGTYFASKVLYLENKEAGEWTLNDLIAVSQSISSGSSASLLKKAATAMNYGVTWNVTLTNGNVATYRIIGINHDNISDGTGKAGLTFEVNNEAFGHDVPYTETKDTNDGWEKSYMRKCLNGGTLYELMPEEYKQAMKSCIKMSDNTANGESGTPTETRDIMFLLSESEIYGTDEDKNGPDNRIIDEGNQYEYYLNKRVGKRMNTIYYAGINLPEFVSYVDYNGRKWYSQNRFIRSKNIVKSSWSAINSSGSTMTTTTACYTCPAFCL